MTRSIEHIVATHQHAQSLRAAGRSIWPYSVDIKSIINGDRGNESAEHIARISNQIAKTLRSKLPARFFDLSDPRYDFNFNDAVEALESNTAASLLFDEKDGFDILEDFNGQLEIIYDWADDNRVWLG